MSLIQNKKARLDYEIIETYQAGMELLGMEVKSLRAGNAKLEGARVIVRGGEAFVIGMFIAPYQPKNSPGDYTPDRTRKLLLSKKEINELAVRSDERGITVVPLAVFIKNNRLKLEIALARGKKKYDKREDLKKKQSKRDIARLMKQS